MCGSMPSICLYADARHRLVAATSPSTFWSRGFSRRQRPSAQPRQLWPGTCGLNEWCMRSPCSHLCSHHAVTMQSPCSHMAVTVQSPCSHMAVTWQSPCSHMQSHAVTWQSPCSHCSHVQSHAVTCSHRAVTCSHMAVTCSHMQSPSQPLHLSLNCHCNGHCTVSHSQYNHCTVAVAVTVR